MLLGLPHALELQLTAGIDKNHTGLCALDFVLIQQNVPIVENKGPQRSVCSISGVCRNAMI